MATFAEHLKKIRTEKGLSQGELAKKVGIHATHVSRYERDLTNPTIDVVKRIADALNVSVDRLIYGTIKEKLDKKIDNDELLHLFNEVQHFDKEDLNCIKSVINAYIVKNKVKKISV